LPALFRSGALDTVREFHDGHHGNTDLDFSEVCFELLQDLADSVASPLPAITTLESRISPTWAGSTACDCRRSPPRRPRSPHPAPASARIPFVSLRQGDALGDGAARRFGRADNSERLRVTLDDDFGAGSNPFQDGGQIAHRIGFADVQRFHIRDHSAVGGLGSPLCIFHRVDLQDLA
jgi:hypothetical protein